MKGNLLPTDRGQRRLAVVFLVNNLGNGMYLPVALLYLTRVGHWSAAQVGLAFTIGGVAALPASAALGYLADRRGPRELCVRLFAIEGAACLGIFLVALTHSYQLLIVTSFIGSAANMGGRAVWGVLIARFGGTDRVQLRARLRALSNVALAIGAAVAAGGIEMNDTTGYAMLVLADTGTFAAAGGLLSRLPRVEPVRRPATGPQLPVWSDGGFVSICGLNVVLSWQYGVVLIAVPVWVVQDTAAPRWIAGAAVAMAAVLVAILQVRATGQVMSRYGPTGGLHRAGMLFLVACVGFALTQRLPSAAAAALLLAATVTHTIGEMWHASAAFEIPYAAAAAHSIGEYQGVFELSQGISTVSAPAILTALCLARGTIGWLVLGSMFAVSAVAIGSILRHRAATTLALTSGRRPK